MHGMNIDKLSDEQVAVIEERMRCNPHRPICFLGDEERLRDIIAQDARTLKDAKADHIEIGRMLGDIIANPDRHPEVRVRTLEQPLECPFEPGTVYLHSNQEFTVRMGFDEFTFPGLLLHLVAAHQFFGGKASPYRLEPRRAVDLLRMHDFSRSSEPTPA